MIKEDDVKTLIKIEEMEQEFIHNPKYKKRYFDNNKQYFDFEKRHPEFKIDKVICKKGKTLIYYSKKTGRPKSDMGKTVEVLHKEKPRILGRMWKKL